MAAHPIHDVASRSQPLEDRLATLLADPHHLCVGHLSRNVEGLAEETELESVGSEADRTIVECFVSRPMSRSTVVDANLCWLHERARTRTSRTKHRQQLFDRYLVNRSERQDLVSTQDRDSTLFAETEVEQKAADPAVVSHDPQHIPPALRAKDGVPEDAMMAGLEAGSEAKAEARLRGQGEGILVDPQLLGMRDEIVCVSKPASRDAGPSEDVTGRNALFRQQSNELRRVDDGHDRSIHPATLSAMA